MTSPGKPPKVSRFSRVLAWIVLLFAAIGVPGMIEQIIDGSWTLGWSETILGILGTLLVVPLFLWIAIKGHAPRWWTPIDNLVKRDLQTRRKAKTPERERE